MTMMQLKGTRVASNTCCLLSFQMYLIISILSALVYLCFAWLGRKRRPPGPWELPFLGYLPFVDPKAPHKTLAKLAKKYGPIYGLHFGSVYTVVLTDPKTIRSAFCKDALTGRAPLYVTNGIMKGHGKCATLPNHFAYLRKNCFLAMFLWVDLLQYLATQIARDGLCRIFVGIFTRARGVLPPGPSSENEFRAFALGPLGHWATCFWSWSRHYCLLLYRCSQRR